MATIKEIFDMPEVQSAPYEKKREIMSEKLKQNNADPKLADQILKGMGYEPPSASVGPQGETALRQGKPIREAISRTYTPVLEALGMAAGTPGFATGPVTGLATTAAGYGIGKETAANLDVAIGLRDDESAGLRDERAKTLPQAGLRALEDLKEGAQLEMGGRLIGRGVTAIPQAINRAGKYFAKGTPEFTRKAEAIAEESGFNPSAAERTASSALSKIEKVLRWFTTSGGEFTERDTKEAAKWVKWRDDLISGVGDAAPGTEAVDRSIAAGMRIKRVVDQHVNEATIKDAKMLERARDTVLKAMGSNESYADLGRSAQQLIKERNRAAAAKAESIYNVASKYLSPEDKVTPTNLMRTANEILQEQNALPPASRNVSLIKRLQEFARGGLPEGEIEGMPGFTMKDGKVVKAEFEPGYTWNAAKQLKGHFREQIEAGDTAVKRDIAGMKFMSSPEAGVYKRLQGALKADLNEFAKQKGGGFEKAMRVADKYYKSRVGFYNDPDVIKMSLEDPEFLLDMVSKPGATTVPGKFRQAAGPKAFEQAKRKLTNRLFGMDSNAPFNPDKVANTLNRYGDTLNEFYTPFEVRQMRDAVDAGRGIVAKGLESNKFFIELLEKDSARVLGGQHLGETSQPVVGFIVRHDNIPLLKRLEPVLGKRRMNNVRATWLSNVIDKNRFELVQPTQLTKLLKTFGEDTLEAFLGKDVTQNLIRMEKVATVQKTVEELARNPSGTAQGLMTYFTAIRTGSALAKGNLWGVIRELWPPNLIAKAYLSPTGTKLLTGTWQLKADTQEAAYAYARLLAVVTAEETKPPEKEER